MRQYTYILLCAVAILAIVSCEKNDLIGSTSQSEVITFTSSVEATKASQTDQDALEEYGEFSVVTFLTDDDNTHYFSDIVSYENSVWSTEATRYWPVNYNLNLFAYSPIEDFIAITGSESYLDYSLTYTCPQDIDDQIDLLVKTLSNQSSTGGAVVLEFVHALSGIGFNIEFEDESNITLNTITLNYVNIEKERTYNFADESWGDSQKIYFTTTDGLSTSITVDEGKTTTDATNDPITFSDIEDLLMIIPQQVSSSSSDPHYISIQISYTLNSAQDGTTTEVETGVMPLPTPTSNGYEQGYIYTYNIIVNGELITFGDITIDDQEDPVAAYGNIDLGLITTYKTASDIGYKETDETDAQFYYTTAERVYNLLMDGVRDFVIVGSMGASEDSDNTLGNGKLGYYGTTSSPFYIGAKLADLSFDDEDLFSIDLRGTYDYPRFADANSDVDYGDDSDDSESAVIGSTTIGDDEPILIAGLFAEIDWLDEVILPNGIAAIGNHAFAGCGALRYIDIAAVEHIEIGAFQDCDVLEVVYNGALTRVHEHGFDSCISLTTIDLSDVVEIDDYGFVDCARLTEVDLGSLEDIGMHAFSGCSELTLVGDDIPSFEMVEDFAFNGCYKLGENGSKIHLEEATKVGDHAFANCQHLQLSSGKLSLLTEVGEYGLSGCSVLGTEQEFEIPNLSIVEMAGFADCPIVNIVDGLSNLEKISYYSFQNCSSLTGYSTSSSTKILSFPFVTEIEGYGLCNTGITNVSFSDNLTTIGVSALNGCSSLTTISGLDKVTSVGTYAFANCTLLEELSLPQLTSDNCGGAFFSFSNSLKTISIPLITKNDVSWTDVSWSEEDEEYVYAYQYSTIIGMISSDFEAIESIDLRSLVLDIPGWHMQKKLNLVYANFASATSVGAGAFADCSLLETLDLSSATSVGDYALQNCVKLKSLDMPLLESAGSSFIDGCSSLVTISLPKLAFDVPGWGTFYQHANLTTVNLPSATSVGAGAFADCTALTALDLRSVTTVGSSAFQGCTALKKLNLSSLSSSAIGDWAFSDSSAGECEIWLSDDEAAEAVGNTWGGFEWKAIYSSSDGVEFTLE